MKAPRVEELPTILSQGRWDRAVAILTRLDPGRTVTGSEEGVGRCFRCSCPIENSHGFVGWLLGILSQACSRRCWGSTRRQVPVASIWVHFTTSARL
jgi:hypothetical protein